MSRSFRFKAGYASAASWTTVSSTDFWIEHRNQGQPSRLAMTIHGTWAKFTQYSNPLERRARIEKAIQSLNELVGREGTLEVDWDQGTTRAMSFSTMMCEAVEPIQSDNSKFYEVDFTFSWPVQGVLARSFEMRTAGSAGNAYKGAWSASETYAVNDMATRLGRTWKALQVNKGQVPAQNAIWTEIVSTTSTAVDAMLVVESQTSASQFKFPFRGTPIRIQNSKGLKRILLTGIRRQITTATTSLGRRQAAEQLISEYVDKIDSEFLLTTDAKSYGNVMLINAQAQRLDLPDAVTFDLEFVTNYLNA